MWSNVILILLLLICVVTDLKERKIYNVVLFPVLCIAWILNVVLGGWDGLVVTFLGTMVGLAILIIPYFMGGMGAGDVKLLAVIGALKGTSFVLMTALYMGLAGGLIAIFIFLFRKGVKARIKHTIFYLSCLKQGVKIPFSLDKEALSTTYPYGVAIAAGAICEIWASAGGMAI
ncbi:A24 family peptidase [Neobacillus sp. D3-1R]|uniref:A24 family peptidase n=1 Tax=Neobacillus sp. D3-1R TaxID=3445778 RepID=UPI003F9EC03C